MIFPELRPNSLFDTDAQVRPRQRLLFLVRRSTPTSESCLGCGASVMAPMAPPGRAVNRSINTDVIAAGFACLCAAGHFQR